MSLPPPESPREKRVPERKGGRSPRPRWKTKFETLKAENETVKAENESLRVENEALKVRIARLEKNSSTSSKPPSSDLVKPKSEQRQPGVRKAGGQRGHPGVKRALLPPEAMNVLRVLPLKACPDCGHGVHPAPEAPARVHQQFELPKRPLRSTQYTRPGFYCPDCARTVSAALPEGVREDELCGPRLQALIAGMKGRLGASYSQLEQFSREVLGLSLSRSTLCALVRRSSEGLRESVEEVHAAVRTLPSVHVDETRWKNSGHPRWVWAACNESLCFFMVQKTRSAVELRALLGDAFAGAIHSDFYCIYVGYPSEKKQFCLAHLMRDVKFLTTLPPGATRDWGDRVLADFRPLWGAWHARDEGPPDLALEALKTARSALKQRLDGDLPPRGAGLTLRDRMQRHWDSLFRFIEDPDLYSPTNNAAERAIRSLVLLRSPTQGSRSEWGDLWIARSQTVFETCRLQHRNAWTFLTDAIVAARHGLPAPSLLPTASPPER